jgi:hypothetical protein
VRRQGCAAQEGMEHALSESPLRGGDMAAGAVAIAYVVRAAAIRAEPVRIRANDDVRGHARLLEEALPPVSV